VLTDGVAIEDQQEPIMNHNEETRGKGSTQGRKEEEKGLALPHRKGQYLYRLSDSKEGPLARTKKRGGISFKVG